jgi:hypothetical protein
MSNPLIKIHNLETNEIIEREMTPDEFAVYDAGNKTYEQKQTEAAAKRQALLDKLGITEDEARLLLGGN